MFILSKVISLSLPNRNVIKFDSKRCWQKMFQTCSPTLAKLFVDNENRYAHKILQDHGYLNVFRKETFQLPLLEPNAAKCFKQKPNWTHLGCLEVLNHLKVIAKYCTDNNVCISHDQFDSFVDYFTVKVFEFTDDQLLEALKILTCIPETDSLNTKNFVEIWSSLDDACVNRLQTWDIDQIHLVCDHYYILNLGKVNRFNWAANRKIGKRIRKMPPKQLIQSMFYCNLLRNPTIEMIDFEVNMATSIEKMSIEEISVMCMGFFKTQTTIKNDKLVNEIYRRLICELNRIEDISFVNIIKVNNLLFSLNGTHSENIILYITILGITIFFATVTYRYNVGTFNQSDTRSTSSIIA